MIRFRNIVVGVDLTAADRLVAGADELTPSCRAALDTAIWIARRFGGSLHLLTSLDVDAHAEELIRDDHAAGRASVLGAAAKALDRILADAASNGVVATTEVAFGRPPRRLLADVADHGRDLVIVGTRRRGAAARNLLGSTALNLVRHSPVPTWIARQGPEQGMDAILAAVDVGDQAVATVEAATALAAEFQAPLHLLHVIDHSAERVLRMGGADDEAVGAWRRGRRDPAEAAMADLEARAAKAGAVVSRHLVEGEPVERILETAVELRVDLIVMCTKSHGGLHSMISGSTVEAVLTETATSMLVVRPVSPA